jgi:hypothetical protein
VAAAAKANAAVLDAEDNIEVVNHLLGEAR